MYTVTNTYSRLETAPSVLEQIGWAPECTLPQELNPDFGRLGDEVTTHLCLGERSPIAGQGGTSKHTFRIDLNVTSTAVYAIFAVIDCLGVTASRIFRNDRLVSRSLYVHGRIHTEMAPIFFEGITLVHTSREIAAIKCVWKNDIKRRKIPHYKPP